MPKKDDINRIYNTIRPEIETIAKTVVPEEVLPGGVETIATERARPMLTKETPFTPGGAFRELQKTRGVIGWPESRPITPPQPTILPEEWPPETEGYRPGTPTPAPRRVEVIPTGGYTETWGAEPVTEATRRGDISAERGIEARETEYRGGIIAEEKRIGRLAEEVGQRERGAAGYGELEAERAAGIVPPTGMAEYEAGAARMRMGPKSRLEIVKGLEARRKEYVAGKQATEKERVGIIPKLYEAERKITTERAKLGLSMQDVASKIQYRNAQMENMFTKSRYLEPMKLQLQETKDIATRNQVQRDFYYKFAQDLWKGEQERLKNAYLGGGPEYDVAYANAAKAFAQHFEDIEIRFPRIGDIKKNPINGKLMQAVEKEGNIKWQPYKEESIVPEK